MSNSNYVQLLITHVFVLGKLLPDRGLPPGVLRSGSARHSAPGSGHCHSRGSHPCGRRRHRHRTRSKHVSTLSLFSTNASSALNARVARCCSTRGHLQNTPQKTYGTPITFACFCVACWFVCLSARRIQGFSPASQLLRNKELGSGGGSIPLIVEVASASYSWPVD